MKATIKTIKNHYQLIIGVLITGIFLGWLIFRPSGAEGSGRTDSQEQDTHAHSQDDHSQEGSSSADPAVWTCSMHPQIRQEQPGQCPICAMDLIPLSTMESEGETVNPDAVVLSQSAAELANIQTITVSGGIPEKSTYLQGKVQADERNIAELTARFGGRMEELYVNFTGQQVRRGEKLATIYSPELVTAQRELLEALEMKEARPSLYTSARTKLKLWDLTGGQIDEIENRGEPETSFDILSPISGTVMQRHVALGDYVEEGSALFRVTDLSSVWVMFDAYERDLPWIREGDHMEFTVSSLPGENFEGPVSHIDPFIDPATRVAGVRVELPNTERRLKPGMFATGQLHSTLAGSPQQLLIPKSSVLWTGKRAVVYVKEPEQESPTFSYREITLGPAAGSNYVVADGLREGEEIAVNGVFKIDAAAQLEGKPSMMNLEGAEMSAGHDHGEMASGRTGSAGHGEMEMEEDSHGMHGSFRVAGNCGMCKDRIETAALAVDGVETADWDLESKELHMNYDATRTSPEEVQKAIAEAGHDTEDFRAPDNVYKRLPGCCKYERMSGDQ